MMKVVFKIIREVMISF